MSHLVLTPNLGDPDRVYARLVDLVEPVSEAVALRRCMAVVLALANHVGDEQVIEEAIAVAQSGVQDQMQQKSP
jgi:hypothetical protein